MADILQFPPNRTPAPEPEPEPLWREALGRSLRAAREEQGDRLVDIAERAGISPQYLSEIERGRKEPSSEMIAAVTGALGVEFSTLLIEIAGDVRRLRRAATRRPTGPVLLAA
ncbi:helix-turn-helix domain-containing protein [Kutzneria kofuensis]|jgi:transcriptional regulator with XRE-family HTH domain|uniref:Transcriptional regulator with XRE-family HTH domain n=1 Tax=Kutzneria kofuensis TaxID=103725 RepID=A0A7W9KCG3_9PSEU|nr:helix-turn-helix transcriptional regulator [Kutzneria kofuensis]MBB5889991.1 transcriptional regulator with XRE-family HTH domain [Kutzneria kofuensis]